MTPTPAETQAMRSALRLAATPGVPLGPNPRVGCVLLTEDESGRQRPIASGYHHGAGSPHAEVEALTAAGEAARGATAVVTLEPCNHTGRTGPCSQALIAAGVRRVVIAQRDPNPVAAGGAATLEEAGIEVAHDVLADEAAEVNRAWAFGIAHGRPLVTWKFAATLDGRSAAADGTSRWISSTPAREETHRLRGECDVLLVGTRTVEVDDPQLTVRDEWDRPVRQQPLRAVMGMRELSADRRIFNNHAETLRLPTRDPAEALGQLYDAGRRHVWLEGGPTLAAAFLNAGLVDEAIAYLAPSLLGAGTAAVGDLGITTIDDRLRFRLRRAGVVGSGDEANVRLTLAPYRTDSEGES